MLEQAERARASAAELRASADRKEAGEDGPLLASPSLVSALRRTALACDRAAAEAERRAGIVPLLPRGSAR